MRACQPGEPVRFIQYGFYPLLLLIMCGYDIYELQQPTALFGHAYGFYLLGIVVLMLSVEAIHPLRAEWRMTRATFFHRDLPFLLIGGITITVTNYAVGWLILHVGVIQHVSHATVSLIPSVILALLIPDFLWYWLHRWSHEGRGPIGRWLWRMHVAHHLPQQVYLLMHGVAHPINTVLVRVILTVPLALLGFSKESLFIANLVVGLQGFVSHFNVDIRAGWLNYLLMGTQLHRYHHSADPREAKNYAAVVSFWDWLFGTLYYQPTTPPAKLGVTSPEQYPHDRQLWQVLALPFKHD